MEMTIQISDETYRTAVRAAQKARRRVDEMIAEKVEKEFSFDKDALQRDIANCSDKEVLQIFESQMPPKQDRRLSRLLYFQQARDLTEKEQCELEDLMQVNRIMTLRKAIALREAVNRGLMQPLNK